jgi:hypothetical protein
MENKKLTVQMDSLDGHPWVTVDHVFLTVNMIRRCKRALEREVEIEAFESWQHEPDPNDERLKASIIEMIKNTRF